MADRSKTAIDSAAPAAEPGVVVELRAKYLDLSRKYHQRQRGHRAGALARPEHMRRLGGSISARNRVAGGAELLIEFLLGADGQALPQDRAPARRRERTARHG